MYVIQLNPAAPGAWRRGIRWAGYWAGLGFVEKPADAIAFNTKRDASLALLGLGYGFDAPDFVKIKKR